MPLQIANEVMNDLTLITLTGRRESTTLFTGYLELFALGHWFTGSLLTPNQSNSVTILYIH